VNNRTGRGIEELLRNLPSTDGVGRTDGELLAQFLACQDEAAFGALVRRHGPMVLATCRRILNNAGDAEDAFQAAFLVLVRKAPALTSRAVLGDWLHGVARRTALSANRAAAQRRLKEAAVARPEVQAEEDHDDWLALLDEALSRLPEKYRLPIVLCDLQGRTRQQAAASLGWPEGTVAGRLARGRTLLARRLLRQGLVLPTAVLSWNTAPVNVPAALAASTLQAAIVTSGKPAAAMGTVSTTVAALTEGVLKTMLLTKVRMTVMVLGLMAVLGAGAVLLFTQQTGASPPQTGQQAQAPERKGEREPQPDGAWFRPA
jgi:RNA polymerase sigma factor (sigma-70 family)